MSRTERPLTGLLRSLDKRVRWRPVTWVIVAFNILVLGFSLALLIDGSGSDGYSGFALFVLLVVVLPVWGVGNAVLSAVWAATRRKKPPEGLACRAPAGGLKAWPMLERGRPVGKSVSVPAHVSLRLQEQRGRWAKVIRVNGAAGWVEARLLVPLDDAGLPASRAGNGEGGGDG